MANGKMIATGKRLFASAIVFMTLTALRFAAVQKLKTLGVDESSVCGTLSASMAKKPHGLEWPFAAPLVGLARSIRRIGPIADFRWSFDLVNGAGGPFLILKLPYAWDIVGEAPISYSAARRMLMLLRIDAGRQDSENPRYAEKLPPCVCRRDVIFARR